MVTILLTVNQALYMHSVINKHLVECNDRIKDIKSRSTYRKLSELEIDVLAKAKKQIEFYQSIEIALSNSLQPKSC
jgi:uncharacterized membrane protein YfbV (UPF0208 family)